MQQLAWNLLEPTCSSKDLPMTDPGPCSVIALTVSLNQPKPLLLICPNLRQTIDYQSNYRYLHPKLSTLAAIGILNWCVNLL